MKNNSTIIHRITIRFSQLNFKKHVIKNDSTVIWCDNLQSNNITELTV